MTKRSTPEFLIALPSAVSIKYVYVTSYAVDGGPSIDCPTEMSGSSTAEAVRKEFPPPPAIAAVPVVSAVFREALPPLQCGKTRIDATVKRAVRPGWPRGLTKSARVQIAVYIDSKGTVVRADVYKSSGSEEADAQAQFAAYTSTYIPAQFLCQPVVSEYLFTSDFEM
ncbi:MAG TPA: TonB C-terminal domain-containing protein [Candidatus Tumulicola sp.]